MINEILKMNGGCGADLHFRLAAEGFGIVLDNPYDPSDRFRQIERNENAIRKVHALYVLKKLDKNDTHI